MTSFVPPKLLGAPRQDAPAEDEDDVDLILQRQFTKRTANAISAMEVTNPALLRATRSCSALQCCGRALHRSFRGDLHHKSFQTDSFDCFWSHSWHGNSWQKILLLMVVYNGRAALIAGHIAAGLGMTLFHLDLLPSYSWYYQHAGAHYDLGPWGFVFGCSTTICMFLVWQPGSKIFLDRICIHQVDEDRKKDGILSLAGFLKRSRSMLVLWDSTYPTRLWTVFELAAFLKSHGDESDLLIRPTILGPTALAVFVCCGLLFHVSRIVIVVSEERGAQHSLQQISMSFVISVVLMHLLRVHFERVEAALLQLKGFTLADTTTQCCTSDHRDVSGNRIRCDREILLECMRTWFGSGEEFERCVRSQVSSAFGKALGRHAFPFKWFIAIASCVAWGFADIALSALRAQEFYYFRVYSLDIFAMPFALGALLYVESLYLGYKLRQRRQGVMNYLLSIFSGLVVVASFVLPRMLQRVLMAAFQDILVARVVWTMIMAMAAILALRMLSLMR